MEIKPWVDVTSGEVRVYKVYDPNKVLEATNYMKGEYPEVAEVLVRPGRERGGESVESNPWELILLVGLNAIDARL